MYKKLTLAQKFDPVQSPQTAQADLKHYLLQMQLAHFSQRSVHLCVDLHARHAELHSSFGSVQDLRTGACWSDLWLSQYSFRVFMFVIGTVFIPLK